MNVVNKDFRDWFFAYHLSIRLHDKKPDILCLIGGETSVYLRELLINYKDLMITHDISVLLEAQGNLKVIVLIALPSSKIQEILRLSAKNIMIWDLIGEYTDYERVRLPENYVVDEFHFGTEEEFYDYTMRRDAISKGYISHYIKKRHNKVQDVLFNKIEIETMNRCNGFCSFCPVNRKQDPRPFCRMDEALFSKIICQLKDVSYDGALGLFSNNEPLLDNRLPAFAHLARTALPAAFLYIYTNGTLLTEELLSELLSSLDLIHVDCYVNKPELPLDFLKLQRYCIERRIPPEKITFHLRYSKEHLTTRAGTAPNRSMPIKVHSLCPLPFSQMIIRPDGKVSQCCNDALGQMTLGDLNIQTLRQIWFGRPFESLRSSMLSGGRDGNVLCRNCDTIFTCLPYEERSQRDDSIPIFPDHTCVSDR